MGNEFKSLPIHKEINRELKNEKLLKEKEEFELKQLCTSYRYNQREEQEIIIIHKSMFKNLIQLSNDQLFEILFKIFGRIVEKKQRKEKIQEEIITFEDLKYLYYSFTTSNIKIKIILLSFLIFQYKPKLNYQEFNNIIFKKLFMKDIKIQEYLTSIITNTLISKNDMNQKAREENEITRLGFIEKIRQNDSFLKEFNFIKPILGESELKQEELKNKFNYICDCAYKSLEDNSENNLETMKKSFDSMTEKTNKVLYFEDFKKLLENSQTHKNIIKLVIDYLKKCTQRDYCCFNDIKYIFTNLNYSLSLNDKKIFLFRMIQVIYDKNKFTYNEIDRYINIDYEQKTNINDNNENIELYNENDFINNSTFDIIIDKLNPYLENFGLIPYLYFKVKAVDKKIKRRLIKDILKNEKIENYEKYLEKNFEEYDFFYAIDINFWNILMNDKEEAPEYINNSRIAEEINLVKEEDRIEEEIEKLKRNINMSEKKEKNVKGTNEENNKDKSKDDKNLNKKQENDRNQNQKDATKKKEEDNNKKEKKKENNENQSNNGKNKDNNDNEKVLNEVEEIRTKLGKLKNGLKYKKDFIILCGQLYQILKTNYKIDYIIKLTKIQNLINLNKSNIKEKKEENDKKNKEKDKENEKDKEKDKDKEGKKEGEAKKETPNEKNEDKGDKEEDKDEDYLNKEKLVKEQLDKYIIDVKKGLITKLVKANEENKYILNELVFYPIQVYQKSFGIFVRMIEKAKIRLDNLEENKKFYQLSEKERNNLLLKKRQENEKLRNRIEKYNTLKEDLQVKLVQQMISENDCKEKMQELKEKYEDIFQKKEKTQDDYKVDITLNEFRDNLLKYGNNILLDRKSEIVLYPRYKTFKDIKNYIISKNTFLKEKKFDIYYFLFSSGTLFKPKDDFNFEEEGKENEEFINIIVDIYNDKGQNFYTLLSNKENEIKEEKLKKEQKEKEKNEKKNIAKKKEKNITKKVVAKKHKLTEEEKKIIKEQERLEKLEKERIEKERKEKEKEERLREKKEREELEKIRKEREKIEAQKEKERKQKEKEEQLRQKQLQKERERELQRQKELEKFVSPPYGINNYGNTCYFNSINQIFLNLSILQQIFLDPKINYFINRTNKFGNQGKFFDIFKNLYWIKLSQVGDTVLNLKKMVGKLKEDFNNSRQQDANEYLNFVLDNLHEDLNLHSTKRYIEEKDDIFKHNTDEELGNISWANNLKRNTSFIDSIFMYQLKSNLKCRKCNTKKVNFETNYIFDLPLSLCKMVTVEIYLYRLPFIYKLYYDKINTDFSNFIKKDENKNNSIIKNLWKYYTNVLSIENKKEYASKLHFYFDLEREKTMIDIIKIIRKIKPLQLEPENIQETFNNEKITEYEIGHLTDLITYSKEKNKIIKPNSAIDKYVNIEDKIILNIYEILNSNGLNKIFEEKNKHVINLFFYFTKKNFNLGLDNFREILKNSKYSLLDNQILTIENSKKIGIISLKEKLVLFPKEEIKKDTYITRRIMVEFLIPIFHYWRSNKKSNYLFRNCYHIKIKEFPQQYIILNNAFNISAKQLYEYIWNLNIIYMNHPNIDTSTFWWNQDKDKLEKEKNIKRCYPFVLRYCELPEKENNSSILLNCPQCPWYSFCPGCIIDPEIGLDNLNSNYGIVVDWCYSFVIEEFLSFNFQMLKEIDSQIISENLPIIDKEENYQSIYDCFKLFFEEENLEDPLFCHHCQGPEDFSKSYTINRLPHVLILSLKRFKYNQNSNFKLRQMITYPLYNLKLGEGKIKKTYDLYGVVNHYGSISFGHYTSIIKNNKNEWILCNDSSVYKIEENRVIHSNAYILFYISKESPYDNDYIKFMKSIMNNIIIKEVKDKKEVIVKDSNFFKNEPVITDYGEGYVVKENLEDFKVDKNYDIYKDLEKDDELRIEKINKKYKNEEKNKTPTPTEEKNKERDNLEHGKENGNNEGKKVENNMDKDKKKGKEEKQDEKNNSNNIQDENKIKNQINEKNEKNNEKREENNIDNSLQKQKEEEENKIEKTNEEQAKISSEKIEEEKEKKTEEINKKEENLPFEDSNEKKKINATKNNESENSLKEENKTNQNETNDENNEKNEYNNNFIKVKFDFGSGWIYKKNVKKYNYLRIEKEEKTKKKGYFSSLFN